MSDKPEEWGYPARKKLLEPLMHKPGEHPAMEHQPVDVNTQREFPETAMREEMDRYVKQDPDADGMSARARETAGEGNVREEGFQGQSKDEKASLADPPNESFKEAEAGGGEPFGLAGKIPPASAYPGMSTVAYPTEVPHAAEVTREKRPRK